jgi:hypothetical protein
MVMGMMPQNSAPRRPQATLAKLLVLCHPTRSRSAITRLAGASTSVISFAAFTFVEASEYVGGAGA